MPRSKKEGGADCSAPPLDVARDIVHVAALEITMFCMQRSLFEQIRRPDIEVPDELGRWEELAEGHAIGYAVAPDSSLPRSGDMLWVIVRESNQLWRWSLTTQGNYDAVCANHSWFAELPQVFLT